MTAARKRRITAVRIGLHYLRELINGLYFWFPQRKGKVRSLYRLMPGLTEFQKASNNCQHSSSTVDQILWRFLFLAIHSGGRRVHVSSGGSKEKEMLSAGNDYQRLRIHPMRACFLAAIRSSTWAAAIISHETATISLDLQLILWPSGS